MNAYSLNDVVRNKVLSHLPEPIRQHTEYHIFNNLLGMEEGEFGLAKINNSKLNIIRSFLYGLATGLMCCEAMTFDAASTMMEDWDSVVVNDLPSYTQIPT